MARTIIFIMNQLRNLYHFSLAWISALIYRHPSRKLVVIGITGTKGKSTAVEILNSLLEASGKKTAMLSSVYVSVAGRRKRNPTETTMPGRFFIQKFLRRAVDAGCTHAVIEVTSQGVIQYRHRFIDWDGGVFLNLHPEHIEAHGSFEAYREAKLSFFRYVAQKKESWAVINTSDPSATLFEKAMRNESQIIHASRERFVNEILGRKREALGEWFDNDFNMEDAALTYAAAMKLDIPSPKALEALKHFKGLPGRMEWVQKEPFGVVIDYAHTPDSLRAVYVALREQIANRPASMSRGEAGKSQIAKEINPSHKPLAISHKLICVLGSAGGGRDKWKRPALGKIAGKYCDYIILTDEDPYEEDPEEILEDIAKGISKDSRAHQEIIMDRREAIEKAVNIAQPGDIVVMTDKGSEEWIHVKGGKKIPWNERSVVQTAIDKSKETTKL